MTYAPAYGAKWTAPRVIIVHLRQLHPDGGSVLYGPWCAWRYL